MDVCPKQMRVDRNSEGSVNGESRGYVLRRDETRPDQTGPPGNDASLTITDFLLRREIDVALHLKRSYRETSFSATWEQPTISHEPRADVPLQLSVRVRAAQCEEPWTWGQEDLGSSSLVFASLFAQSIIQECGGSWPCRYDCLLFLSLGAHVWVITSVVKYGTHQYRCKYTSYLAFLLFQSHTDTCHSTLTTKPVSR
jgi:hypothetical protein